MPLEIALTPEKGESTALVVMDLPGEEVVFASGASGFREGDKRASGAAEAVSAVEVVSVVKGFLASMSDEEGRDGDSPVIVGGAGRGRDVAEVREWNLEG